jgi:hypothetical protein
MLKGASKMKIIIPPNNIEERKYIIDIIFNEFLGLDYNLEIKEIDNYEIVLENGNKLIIEDHFFNKFTKDLEYLDEKNIPEKIEFAKNDFIVEKDIPIIYGTNKLTTNYKSPITLTCGIDIFASSFFMLTRWEEYFATQLKFKFNCHKNPYNHNKLCTSTVLAFRNNFLDRPVVNEYLEMLWNMLIYLGCIQKRKKRNFQFLLTHDIDNAFRYRNILSGIKELLGHLLKRKNISLFLQDTITKIKVHLNLAKDPYDTYDYLMDISESIGTKSYFFLHSSKYAKQDIDNDKFLEKISKKIIQRGHFIGYHPSYNSYNNLEIFLKDKERIENIIDYKLTFGRQHFLRFEIPTTWQIWEDAGMEWDSTLSYPDKEGFRCGICYPFSAFNIKTRKKLKLIERPLIVMEGSLIDAQKFPPNIVENKINNLIQIVKKYEGEFVFLWHNSNFKTSFWKPYNKIYEKVLKLCAE